MRKKIILIIILSLVIVLALTAWYFSEQLAKKNSEKVSQTGQNILNKSESSMVKAYTNSTEESCNSLGNSTLGNNCFDWIYLKNAKRGDLSSCVRVRTDWGKFMCGFIQNPTIEYCNKNISILRRDPTVCNFFVDFVTNPDYNDLSSFSEEERENFLITKAFYLSDGEYCNSMSGLFKSVPKDLCYAVASR